MEYKYQPTRDIRACVQAFKNSAEENSQLLQSFKGKVVDLGQGKFKDMKFNTSLRAFANDLDTCLDSLIDYCTSYGQDEKVAKWVMNSVIEYINIEMLDLVGKMTNAIQSKFKGDVNKIHETKKELTAEDLAPAITDAAKAMLVIVGKDGDVRSTWQIILDWASENLNSKRSRQITEALDGLEAIMTSRYDAASNAKESGEAGKGNVEALKSIYIKKVLKPLMAAMQKFSEAKQDPGAISEKIKDDDILLVSGKVEGFNSEEGKEQRHFFTSDEDVKKWFNYILGLSDEEPNLNDQDFRDEAQVFHDNIKRTYQTMKETWEGAASKAPDTEEVEGTKQIKP